MSSTEFTDWIAYYQIEPFGDSRDDERIGTLIALMYNLYRKKGTKTLEWSDIFLPFDKRKPKTWQDQLTLIEQLNTLFGGIDLRQDKSP